VSSNRPTETDDERADRNLNELLQELRVAQTGVQILFAFLLTLPFTQRFHEITNEQRVVYLLTLATSALATVCIIGPVSHHRILFQRGLKPQLVQATNRLANYGLIFLWISIVLSVFLIFDVVVNTTAAAIAAAVLAVVFLLIWYVHPLRIRARRDNSG
jgi:amino acid permease